jgi:hypothetical protein
MSWRAAVLLWRPSIQGVGKAWISLDSLVRIEPYQWVTREFRWRIFRGPFAPSTSEAAERKAAGEAVRRAQNRHRASLNLDSNFLQLIVVPMFPPNCLTYKQAGLGEGSINRTAVDPTQANRATLTRDRLAWGPVPISGGARLRRAAQRTDQVDSKRATRVARIGSVDVA